MPSSVYGCRLAKINLTTWINCFWFGMATLLQDINGDRRETAHLISHAKTNSPLCADCDSGHMAALDIEATITKQQHYTY